MKDKHSRKSFRIGCVRGDLRGKVWYLTYHENGTRHRPRVGANKQSARQLAAQINSQLEVGVPAALSFEPISIIELQQRWLQHHEQVLRSSVHTINRYRSATGIPTHESVRCWIRGSNSSCRPSRRVTRSSSGDLIGSGTRCVTCVTLIEDLRENKIRFKSISDGAIDTTTASGDLIFNIFSALAQFEQRLIQERTNAGLAAARARGRTGARFFSGANCVE